MNDRLESNAGSHLRQIAFRSGPAKGIELDTGIQPTVSFALSPVAGLLWGRSATTKPEAIVR